MTKKSTGKAFDMLTQSNPPIPKKAPYIWVTWLPALIDGANHCEWAAWFQANYKFDKARDENFFADWNMKHNSLLRERSEQLEAEGYDVYIEDANYFQILGSDKRTIIAGKPDIVAVKGDEVVVEDCKTGKQRSYDHIQVLLYMLLLPAPGGPEYCSKKKIEGRLVYNGEIIDVPSDLLTGEFKKAFKDIAHMASCKEPSRKVPSVRECRFCSISSEYCSDRMESRPTPNTEEEHDLF